MPVRGIAQADGLHGAEAQGVAAAAGEDLDGQAAFEVVELLPFLGFGGLGGEQGVEEAVVLGAVHGAVDVVGGALVPAGGEVDALHVDGFGIDDGGDGIVEGQVPGAGDALDLLAERVGGERAGGEDGALACRSASSARACDLLANHADVGLGGDGFGDAAGELDAIDGEGVARRDGRFVGNAQKRGAAAAHLLLEQPGRGVGRLAFEGVGADQFAEVGGLVGGGEARLAVDHGAHLVEIDLAAEARGGERGFRAGEAAADDANSH